MIKPPLILTLSIDEKAFLFFNALRKKYFPAVRNVVDAHLTLFHALPNETSIFYNVASLSTLQSAFVMAVSEVVSIGKGVAYKIESEELLRLHKSLQNKWLNDLSPQDRQKLWPHITVQNKVPPHEAKELSAELKNTFTPFSISATGLKLWEYLNGPWKLIEEFNFKNQDKTSDL